MENLDAYMQLHDKDTAGASDLRQPPRSSEPQPQLTITSEREPFESPPPIIERREEPFERQLPDVDAEAEIDAATRERIASEHRADRAPEASEADRRDAAGDADAEAGTDASEPADQGTDERRSGDAAEREEVGAPEVEPAQARLRRRLMAIKKKERATAPGAKAAQELRARGSLGEPALNLDFRAAPRPTVTPNDQRTAEALLSLNVPIASCCCHSCGYCCCCCSGERWLTRRTSDGVRGTWVGVFRYQHQRDDAAAPLDG